MSPSASSGTSCRLAIEGTLLSVVVSRLIEAEGQPEAQLSSIGSSFLSFSAQLGVSAAGNFTCISSLCTYHHELPATDSNSSETQAFKKTSLIMQASPSEVSDLRAALFDLVDGATEEDGDDDSFFFLNAMNALKVVQHSHIQDRADMVAAAKSLQSDFRGALHDLVAA
jgi:hypothetical protein